MNIRATAKHFSFLASCVTGYDVSVNITDEPDVVGYTQMPTQKRASITLSHTATLYDGVSDGQKLIYMLGVLAHESLHLCYTAFDEIKRKSIVFPRNADRDAFHEVCNVVEDPAIEYAASNKIGGKMLKALSAVIKHTWENAPPIHEGILPQEAESTVYTQVIRALIQAGDRGHLKGHFMCDTARDVFAKVLPLFNAAIVEPDGEERVRYYAQIYQILSPYSRKEARETSQPLQHGASLPIPNGIGDGESVYDAEDEGAAASASNVGSVAAKKQELRKRMESALNKASADDSADAQSINAPEEKPADAQSPTESQTATATQTSDAPRHFDERPFDASSKDENDLDGIDEDMVFTEEEVDSLMNDIQQAEVQLQIHEAAEAELSALSQAELLADTNDVINCRADNPNEERYNSIIEQYSPKIATLSNELQKIFMNDHSRVKTSNHGTRINTRRLVDGKLHTSIMLQRTFPKDLDDMAVYILIDKSGSMSRSNGKGKSNDQCAAETAICLYEALRRLRIPVYITGFTTRGSKALHIHYVTWNSPQSDRYTLANFAADDCNYDYYSIAEATRVLKKHNAKHKLLIVLSDGAPCNPAHGMGSMSGVNATAAAITQARKTTDVLGVAMNCFDTNVYTQMYGKDYITVSTANDMFVPISDTLQKIVKSW